MGKVDFAMIIHLATLLLSLVSIAVTAVLIGVLSLQEAYAHIKAVKRLLIDALIAFIGMDMVLLVRRVSLLDEAATIIAIKVIYSLTLFAAATVGSAATVIYRKPKSYTLKDIYADAVKFFPFASFLTILLIFFISDWIVPLSVELRSCPTSYTDLYVPIFESQHLIIFSVSFIAFLVYPTAVFLLASYAVENVAVSRDLRMFAIGVIGVAVSSYLEAFFLVRCFAEAVDIIRIPCFITLTYVFRRTTALQSFRDVELREYIEQFRRRK